MEQKENKSMPIEQDHGKAIFTIPNLLSMFRLVLLPVLARTYMQGQRTLTVVLLLVSAATDIVDGWVARTFHMTSDLGKALDPIADKLTQLVLLLCLALSFRSIRVLLIAMVVKELIMGLEGIVVLRATGTTYSARWHGKANTCAIHTTLLIHIIWADIPVVATTLLVCLCLMTMMLSLVLYTVDHVHRVRAASMAGKQ